MSVYSVTYCKDCFLESVCVYVCVSLLLCWYQYHLHSQLDCGQSSGSEGVFDLGCDLCEDLSYLLLPVEDMFGLGAPQFPVARLCILTALTHFLLLLLVGEGQKHINT